MRQVAIDAASIPKDAKIAVLEKSSAESEKMIAEARSDKLKQTAEIQQTQKRMSDMEYQIKALEKELTDRDSIISILQKSAYHAKSGENVLSIPIQDTATSPHIMSHSPLSHLGLVHHSPQLSSPAPLSVASRQQAAGVAEFFDGISRDMSSTTRGPLGKLRAENKVSKELKRRVERYLEFAGEEQQPSSHPAEWDTKRGVERHHAHHGADGAHQQEGLSPQQRPVRELLRENVIELPLVRCCYSSIFRLINTSELYHLANAGQPVSLSTSGTLPKMSFALMKEELSRLVGIGSLRFLEVNVLMCQDAAEQRTAGSGGEIQRGATLQEGLRHLLA